MKRFLLALAICIGAMIPATAGATPIGTELHGAEVPDIAQVQPLKVELKPQTTLEPLYVPVSNPCVGGCGYGAYPLQCTRWAAIVREKMGYPVPNNLGDAKEWPANAAAQGLEIGDHAIVGAVAIDQGGVWGHSMVVTSVLPNGSFMVTEANFDFQGSIRDRLIGSPAGLTFIYY